MNDEGSYLGNKLGVKEAHRGGEVMAADRGTWAAVALVAIGTFLVGAALVPAVVSGPTNPYAAMGLVVLALGLIAGACAVEGYGVVRRYAKAPVAILAALVACVPAMAPVFQPGGADLSLTLVWMVLLALATLLVRRSQAAWVLAAVTALPVVGLFALSFVH